MEATMYFVLGMLSIIAAAIVTVVVWGMFKIIKLSKTSKSQEDALASMERNTWDNVSNSRSVLYRRIDEVESNIYRKFSEVERELNQRFVDIENEVERSRAYTDHRVDKLIDSQGAKKLIKDLIILPSMSISS